MGRFNKNRFMDIAINVKNKIPVTIFTGFLGSGKTTIISHLLDYLLNQNIKVVYVKNEIGEEDIDGMIMRGKHIKTWQLLNGCICCTLTGQLYYAITEIIDTINPQRIIIEASGVASPAALALFVSSHPGVYRDGLIAVIDVVNFEGYKDLSFTAREQAKLTDLIIFNKIELADFQRKQAVVGFVREYNDYAPIMEAPDGYINPDLVFGLDENIINSKIINEKSDTCAHNHLQNDAIETFSIENIKEHDVEALRKILTDFPPNLIRIKGYIKTKEKGWFLVNKVGLRIDFKTINQPENIFDGKLVFIGFGIKQLKDEVLKNLGIINI